MAEQRPLLLPYSFVLHSTFFTYFDHSFSSTLNPDNASLYTLYFFFNLKKYQLFLSPWIASLFPISVSWIPPVFSYLHVNMPSDFLVSVLFFPSYLPLSYFWRRLPFVFHACLWHLLTSPRHVSSGKFRCHLKCLSITLKTQGNFCKIKPSRDEGVKASSRGVSFSEFIVINQVLRQIRIDTSSSS